MDSIHHIGNTMPAGREYPRANFEYHTNEKQNTVRLVYFLVSIIERMLIK